MRNCTPREKKVNCSRQRKTISETYEKHWKYVYIAFSSNYLPNILFNSALILFQCKYLFKFIHKQNRRDFKAAEQIYDAATI